MSKHIYAFVTLIEVGREVVYQPLNVIASTFLKAQAVAHREAREQAEHMADAQQIIDGERPPISIDIAALQ